MKRIIAILTLLVCSLGFVSEAGDNNSKDHDFMLEVLANPTFSIYDFHVVGINSSNTSLKPLTVYLNSAKTKEYCRINNISVREAYSKVSKAWEIFKDVEKYESEWAGGLVSFDGRNIYAPKNPSPRLKEKLKTIPLKL